MAMKTKIIITGIAFAIVSTIAFGQGSLTPGKSQLNLGVGLSTIGTPFYAGFDYCAARSLTFGGELSYRSWNERWNNYHYSQSITGISANGNYHFNSILEIPSRFDLYAGLNLGFYIWNSPADYPGTNSSGLGLGGQLGGRFFLTQNVGLNLEFGSGNEFTGGKFGLTIKLR